MRSRQRQMNAVGEVLGGALWAARYEKAKLGSQQIVPEIPLVLTHALPVDSRLVAALLGLAARIVAPGTRNCKRISICCP